MVGSFLNQARGLMEIKRYSNKIMHNKRSVGEHSWFVCIVAEVLTLWERDKFKNEVDIVKVNFFAMHHDTVECLTGDISSPVKNVSQEFRNALNKVESYFFENDIIGNLPKSQGGMFLNLHDEMSELVSIESRIVKASDLIDRVYEMMDEITLGNKQKCEGILRKDLIALSNMNIMCVDYFLKYALKDLEGAEEYLDKEIKSKLNNIDFSKYF